MTFGFSSQPPILVDFSLTLLAGGTTVILGPSGSGKTTLVRLLCGLIKPSSGTVLLDDAIFAQTGRIRGVLFQDDTLVPWLTVFENAIFPVTASSNPELVKETLKRLSAVGLNEAIEQLPHELSGGMKKRLEFVRATSKDDQYLIADEPFSGLDFHQKRALWRLWRCAMEDKTRTGILITQDVDEAVALGDRFVVTSGERPIRIVLDIRSTDIGDKAKCRHAIVGALMASTPKSLGSSTTCGLE